MSFSTACCRHAARCAFASMFFLLAAGVPAQTTNGLSGAEIQGRQLVQQLLVQRPVESFTNSGTLKILQNGKRTSLFLTVTTTARPDNYQVNYEVRTNSGGAALEWLKIIHAPEHGNVYYTSQHLPGGVESGVYDARLLRGGNEVMIPFAGSDFWLGDLGLEFFNWPQQKLLKKEVKRSRGCSVLESTNPDPGANGYSRVVSWIDSETLGIVQAQAYDAQGKPLKEFYPKDFKKVDGQWRVQMMQIENVQTGSRTRLEFDVDKP